MAIARTKVAVIGCGSVGSTLAFNLACEHICDDIMLIDINKSKAKANANDLKHLLGFSRYNMSIGSGDYSMCGDVDVIILAVSAPYREGMTRADVLGSAGTIVSTVIPEIMNSGFSGFFVVITNPVDTMTYLVQKISGLAPGRVIGTGTALDSARLRYSIAQELQIDHRSVEGYCLGEHGESRFIPWSCVRVGDVPISRIIGVHSNIILENIEKTVKEGGDEIIQIKGASVFGIVSVTAQIVKAILADEARTMPVSAMLDGEYGFSGVYVGVPAVIGASGIEKIIELPLNSSEAEKFRASVGIIKETARKIAHLAP